jgi:hypothetical protein
MANPSTQRSSFSDTSHPSNPPPSARLGGWSRTGDPGSAFSGLSRGRGGRSIGRGTRGGRGGRGRPHRGSSSNAEPQVKVPDTSEGSATPSSSTLPQPPAPKPPISSPITPIKTKPNPNRNSRTMPILVVDSSSVNDKAPSTASGNSSSRSSNRRRRSQQQIPAAITTTKLDVPDSKFLRPHRARSGPPTPSLSPKDIPPHLPPTAGPDSAFDIRNDVDALVERVRAVAMADNRPTTPGSHIDWAGDEDDTLPDLDDWGVTAGSNSGDANDSAISPLSVSGLIPLPEPCPQLHVTAPPKANNLNSASPVAANGSNEPTARTIPSNEQIAASSEKPNKSSPSVDRKNFSRAQAPRPLQLNEPTRRTDDPPKVPPASAPPDKSFSLITPPPPLPRSATSEHFKLPLHPSLPQKPVAMVDNIIAQQKPGTSAMPMRAPVPLKPLMEDVGNKIAGHVIVPVDNGNVRSADEPTVHLDSEEQPLSSVVQASDSVPVQPVPSPVEGLTASIHAPKPSSDLLSPANSATQTTSTAFNPAHARNHTVGHSYPHSAPHHFFSRSASSTPRGHLAAHNSHHARTRSTPPPSNFRAPHAVRPVITGDAISRLARTIGSIPPSKPHMARE